jgi:2-polyprenyl-6-methoxyphenol hydroxylase-like FAD-dependent oxidoreductase
VVLESRQEIAPAEGASIAIYPHGARILHQIGCLEAAKAACVPCQRFVTRGNDGKVFSDSGFFDYIREKYA